MVGRHLEVVLAVLLFASVSANSPSQQLRGSTREPVALALGETNSTSLAAVLATAASTEAPSAPDVPAWCQYMPQDAACHGSSAGGCTCSRYCGRDVPAKSWQSNPQCCGCGQTNSSTVAATTLATGSMP
mmetsp:Transcript_18785/g.52003  ORF Transcript_18785/g.52003 Transcript_18785/m.52003 type:complete len:130 (-) Transcript_18785:264-653(-)